MPLLRPARSSCAPNEVVRLEVYRLPGRAVNGCVASSLKLHIRLTAMSACVTRVGIRTRLTGRPVPPSAYGGYCSRRLAEGRAGQSSVRPANKGRAAVGLERPGRGSVPCYSQSPERQPGV